MRLVYTCRNFTLRGGQSRIAWELARRADRDHHDVHIVARGFPDEKIKQTAETIYWHRVFQLPRLFGPWRFRSFAHLASRRADTIAGQSGLVHGFGDSYRQDIITLGNVDWNYGKYIKGRRPGPMALRIKKRSFLDPLLKFLVLVSNQMKQDLLDLYPEYNTNKVRVIYPGVDITRYSPSNRTASRAALAKKYGISPEATWLVSGAGGDFEKRNSDTLAKTLMKLLHRKNWVFLFAGGTADDVRWPRELMNRSHFLGRMEDTSTLFPGCDLLLYPAWYDEFSLFCLEAMASGLPLVLSSRVGAGEVLPSENRASSVLSDPGDADELAAKTENFLSAPALRKKTGAANHQAAQAFSWDLVYQRYMELYEEIRS